MRFYEGMFLVDSAEVQKDCEGITNSLVSLLKKHNCEILRNERWNDRKLAYPVKKRERGTYFVIHFNAEQKNIGPLRRDCQLSEFILRSMITVCPVALENLPPIGTGPKEEPEAHVLGEEKARPVRERPLQALPHDPEVEPVDAFEVNENFERPHIKVETSKPRQRDDKEQ